MRIRITIMNANVCRLTGETKLLKKLYDKFVFKHHNAYHIMMMSKTDWDGMVKYINNSGTFQIGLLSMVYKEALEITKEVEIIDNRPPIPFKPKIPKKMGDLTLRPEQYSSLKSLLNNKVGGIPFLVCCANLAVNFGKTLIFTAIHKSYNSKLRTLLLLNDSDLFKQFKKEIPLLLPDENVTFIQGGKVTEWSQFNVAMVPSLSRNIDTYKDLMASVDITLIDEADIIDNKTFKTVLKNLYNTQIRIGLSGTLYKGNLKKHIIPNMNIRSFIGDMVENVSLAKQIKRGNSTRIIVKSITLDYEIDPNLSYDETYQAVIVDNPKAYECILERIKFNLKYGRLPMLVATKYIPHTERLESYLQKELPELKIKGVHHKTKNREAIIEDFRNGNIDLLIATTIISRGKNIPLLQYTCNASSMDAEERTIQLVGRSARLHESKTKAVIDDLIFPGPYLKRHGNHRKNYYLRENLKVINIPRKPRKNRRKSKSSIK